MAQSVADLLTLPWLAQIAAPTAPVGGYLALWKIIISLILITPWLAAAPWVHKDAERLNLSPKWSAGVLAVGAAGLLLWLLLPIYLVGLLVYLVLTAAVYAAYAVQHDAKVPPEQKLLTGAAFSAALSGKKRLTEQVQAISYVKLYDCHAKSTLAPDETSDVAVRQAYNTTQRFLHNVLWRRASEVDLSPAGNQTRLRYVIDGVVMNRPAMELAESEAIIQYLKPLAGMNAEERRRPQTGQISADLGNGVKNLALTTAGTTGGQRMQFRIIQEAVQTKLDSLGMSEEVLQKVQAFGKADHGLIIVSGRSGSGVTSTLYSLLRDQDVFIKRVVTLESKAVVDLENITQNSYEQDAKLPEMLASVLRREPDVVMVDRCGDPKTARLIRQAAAKKLTLLGVTASDAFVALAKWVHLCGEPSSEALANLHGVLCQVLVRKLCLSCRQAYRPDPQFLAKANLPVEGIGDFYRAPTKQLVDEKGQPFTCPACQGSGYVGRTGAFELLEITDEIRQLVVSGASVSQIKAAARKNKMLYLQEQSLRKVIKGVTSIQEVIRVTQTKK